MTEEIKNILEMIDILILSTKAKLENVTEQTDIEYFKGQLQGLYTCKEVIKKEIKANSAKQKFG